jgi:hypothetical protein
MVEEHNLEKLFKTEEWLRAIKGKHLCDLVKIIKIYIVHDIMIPKKFKMPKLIKYNGT